MQIAALVVVTLLTPLSAGSSGGTTAKKAAATSSHEVKSGPPPAATMNGPGPLDDPRKVGLHVRKGIERVRLNRLDNPAAFFFNWALHIERGFQLPFEPTHEAMAALNLHRGQPPHELAANLRRAFSGIVAGNVKEGGMRAIEEHGPFDIDGDRDIMQALDALLASFVVQQRMKLPGARYVPCYRIHAA